MRQRADIQQVIAPSEEAAIAAFIRLNGITRCPTAYAVPAGGTITKADQAALETYVAAQERLRHERIAGRKISLY